MALRSFANGAVFAEVFGEGSPGVLALHGWGRRGSDFGASLGSLPAIALDLPGFGASPAPDSVIGGSGYADIVAPILDEFDGPPVLVGHSFGGRVAVCLAAKHPERVGPLVLTGVPLLRSRPSSKPALGYRIIRSLHGLGLISDGRMEAERQKRGSADYRAATGVMRDILVKVVNEEYPDEMAAIRSPVHLIWGRDDTEVPVSVARRSAEMIGDCSLEVIDDVGHMLPVQDPERLRVAVEGVL